MNKYLQLSKVTFGLGFVYRAHFFFAALGNIVYIALTYFLWKAIYRNTESTLHGMSFEDTFLYLAVASVIYFLFRGYVEHEMSDEIIEGRIIMNFLKPLDYQKLVFFRELGFMGFNFVIITLPTFMVLMAVFNKNLNLGYNALFFIAAVVLAFLLSFTVDFMTGCIAFYTESTWGIIIAKESVVLFLAGALVPIQFFPENMQKVVMMLPFRAIYQVPVSILTDNSLGITDYLSAIGLQCFWLAVFYTCSRAFFNQSVKAVTVNGG